MRVVGLSALYHEATCCLLVDGEVVAAASEERFSRVKHDPRLPVEAFRWCLEAGGGLAPCDLDAVAWYELPEAKHDRQLRTLERTGGTLADGTTARDLDPERPRRLVRERLGFDGPLLCYPHHLSHAASAFCFSGFPEAAILTIDGVGEWATTTYGVGRHGEVELFEEVRFPHSLGLFYSAITALLGFRVNGGEYKVMGLAPYGEPRYADRLREVVRSGPGGGFTLDLECFDFLGGERMYSEALSRLLGGAPRRPDEEMTPWHADVARSAQLVLEEILLEKVRYLHDRVGGEALCAAGGVALNCVANGRILREGPFRRLFVQPAAGDAGGALGAAALAHRELTGAAVPVAPLRHVFLGPGWSGDEVARLLTATGLPHRDLRGREADLLADAAERLAAGQVIGWFQGRMELGPRALGARSILASPLDLGPAPGMRERINRKVKKREGFRPFAPAVLADRAAEHFDLGPGSEDAAPYMLLTCRVTSPLALPAVTHVDGSARPQTVDPATAPRFAALLREHERRTGCPILLDTSFNVAGEPIVRSPADALASAAEAGLDGVVLGDFVIDGADLPADLPALLAPWREPVRSRFAPAEAGESAISDALYTFV